MQNYLKEDLFAHLPMPKVPRQENKILAGEKIGQIYAELNPATWHGKRSQTMITLLLDIGIIASEFLSLQVDKV